MFFIVYGFWNHFKGSLIWILSLFLLVGLSKRLLGLGAFQRTSFDSINFLYWLTVFNFFDFFLVLICVINFLLFTLDLIWSSLLLLIPSVYTQIVGFRSILCSSKYINAITSLVHYFWCTHKIWWIVFIFTAFKYFKILLRFLLC